MLEGVVHFASRHAFVVGNSSRSGALRSVGETPNGVGIDIPIPAGGSWWAQPLGGLSAGSARALREHRVPGVWLDQGHDGDLRWVSELSQVEWLKISDAFPGCTDLGLESLGQGTRSLVTLEVQGEVDRCALSARGVQALASMGLKRVYGNWLSDDLFEALAAGLPGLTTLDLSFCPLTDHGLAAVARLTDLEVLDVSDCPGITDASVEVLCSLTKLDFLGLGGTGLSPEGVGRLREHVGAGCWVEFEG